MTTSQSPLAQLQVQADRIASIVKKAERGEPVSASFAARIAEARGRPSFKIAVVMDDKTLALDLPWAVIRDGAEADLAAYILAQMQS